MPITAPHARRSESNSLQNLYFRFWPDSDVLDCNPCSCMSDVSHGGNCCWISVAYKLLKEGGDTTNLQQSAQEKAKEARQAVSESPEQQLQRQLFNAPLPCFSPEGGHGVTDASWKQRKLRQNTKPRGSFHFAVRPRHLSGREAAAAGKAEGGCCLQAFRKSRFAGVLAASRSQARAVCKPGASLLASQPFPSGWEVVWVG